MRKKGYEPESDIPTPEELYIESERQTEIKKEVHSAIRQLNPRQQDMVQMIFFEDKSQDEVAEHFGISKQAVSNAMQRIYAALKKFLEKIKIYAARPCTDTQKLSNYSEGVGSVAVMRTGLKMLSAT